MFTRRGGGIGTFMGGDVLIEKRSKKNRGVRKKKNR